MLSSVGSRTCGVLISLGYQTPIGICPPNDRLNAHAPLGAGSALGAQSPIARIHGSVTLGLALSNCRGLLP